MASAIGKEKLAVSNAAVAFASVTATAYSALVSVESGAIRYYADGSTPTATDGIPAEVGDQFIVSGGLSRFKAIRRDSADATLQIIYFDDYLDSGKTSVGSEVVGGNVAGGSTDAGNPVKIGGLVSTTVPGAQTTGKRVDVWCGASGQVIVGTAAPSINDGLPAGPAVMADSNNTLRALAALGFVFNGATNDRLRSATKFVPLAATAIGAEATVWTPAGGKKFRLMGFTISTSAAVSIVLKDNTGGTTIYQVPKLLVDTPLVVILSGNGILSAAANNVLTATSSAAANLIGTFFGTEE